MGTPTVSSLTLGWTDNSDSETGFQIERSLTSGSGFVLIHTTAANVNSYVNTGLNDGIQYFYRVRATNLAGQSGYSNEASGTTVLAPPAAPSGLTVGSATVSSLTLGWTDNSDSETGFVIERSLTSGSGYSTIYTTGVNVTSYVNTGLNDGTQYYYRVRATNAAGPSANSNEASGTTLLAPPDAPTGLSVGTPTVSSLTLGWTDNSDSETGFQIERSLTSGSGFVLIHTTAANVNSYVNTGLNDGIQYFYRVRATNLAGQSGYSNEASGTTVLAPPAAPSGLNVGNPTTSTLQLDWTDNSDNETGFEVERSLTVVGGYSLVTTAPANATNLTDTGLEDDTRYYYRVRAINAAGPSSYSNTDNARTLLAVPVDPGNLVLGGITISSINLTWADNSDNETGFQIERSLLPLTGFSLIHTTAANITSYNNTGLEDNTTYYYRIRAINAAGSSGYTAVASATTLLSVPVSPTGLTLSGVTNNSITLNWNDNSDNESGFEIERSLTPVTGFALIFTTAANATSYTNTGLAEDTRYYYRVRAVNAAGPSGYTGEASAKTLLLAPPAPTNLLLSNVTTSSIDLAWTDNSVTETGFEIERSLLPGSGFVLIHTTLANVTTYSNTGLDDATRYYYRVRAVNATGPSAYTLVASAQTLLAIPVPPSGLEATATTTCSVELKWIDNSDNEAGFQIERSILPTSGFALIQTTAPDITTFTDPGRTNNTNYYYRVRAFNAAGNSAYTSTANVFINIILNGGLIGPDQTVCPSGDPLLIQNLASPLGGSGNWTYQWQFRVPPAAFGNIATATALTYDPPAGLVQTTQFQRVSTTECGAVNSNTVIVTVEDQEDPVFEYCPNDTVVFIERNMSSGIATPFPPLVSDNCGVVLQTWTMSGATSGASPATGINTIGSRLFNLGVTSITYTVRDASANTAQCKFNLTIKRKIPEVLNVSIPDVVMNIGDEVTATISVGEDGNSYYSLVSGSIGGYPLYNRFRLNSTTYLAKFAITENGNSYAALEDIPVTNLVITDGTNQSLPYNKPIVQPNDLLDSRAPVIISVTAVSGSYKIGDNVILNIVADGSSYVLHPSSIINGIFASQTNIRFFDLGGGSYRLSYTVKQGDDDVGPGELMATIMLVKPSGNLNLPYSNIANIANLTIDAHAPVISRMEVPSVEVGVGGVVQLTITADGAGYSAVTGTSVNGIPLSSPRVTFSERSPGLYEIDQASS